MPLVCDLGIGTPSGLPTTQSHTWLGTPNIDDTNGGFNGKIVMSLIYKLVLFRCHFWLPERRVGSQFSVAIFDDLKKMCVFSQETARPCPSKPQKKHLGFSMDRGAFGVPWSRGFLASRPTESWPWSTIQTLGTGVTGWFLWRFDRYGMGMEWVCSGYTDGQIDR